MVKNNLGKSLRNSVAVETKNVDLFHNIPKKVTKKTATKSSTLKTAKPATSKPNKSKIVPATKNVTAAKPKAPARRTQATNKAQNFKSNTATTAKLPDNFIGLTHNKLHRVVETNYTFCETCLENLQRVNNNLHDYLNQLVEINNFNSLIKLNLSYISALPTRYQEMVAQNKNTFSSFFKFARPTEE